jgi:hypothetical protein
MVTGQMRDAEASVTEPVALAGELGQHLQVVVLTSMSAWRGAVCAATAARVLDDNRQHEMSAALLIPQELQVVRRATQRAEQPGDRR